MFAFYSLLFSRLSFAILLSNLMSPRAIYARFSQLKTVPSLLCGVLLLMNADLALALDSTETPKAITLIQVLAGTKSESRIAIRKLRRNWRDSYIPPLAELLRLNTDEDVQNAIVALLERKTGRRYGSDYLKWHRYSWSRKLEPIENYPAFKAWLYGNIDARFRMYFSSQFESDIRLDEVIWGGVVQDGIPPLRNPKMIPAAEASYLDDGNVVFAIEINGSYRAYPKRILAWHEMFTDTIAGVEVVGVYCPLCGAMIVYETELDGVKHKLGTSGFLYRSNKLMYDAETKSLWNSFWGKPVMGPLVNKGVSLKRRSVITTTWKEWKSRHPETTVLSLETGYEVDYGEGVAYRDYFATDKLMFSVPTIDTRLKNKAEILGLVVSKDDFHYGNTKPLAISADYLMKNPIHYDKLGDKKIVILTDKSGANRVFNAGVIFERWDGREELTDIQGRKWKITESRLECENGDQLDRVPAHRAFWFGWYSAFEDTRLIY